MTKMKNENTAEFLTVPEVASLLRVNASKIISLIHKGELRASDVVLKRGGKPRWRVSRESLASFLRDRENTKVDID